jgi:putative glycosyltransferase (TIGR04372 family)
MIESIKRQYSQIKNKKFLIIKKIYILSKKIIYVLLLVSYVPILLIFLFLSSVFKIRIAEVNSKRIGHFSSNTDLYISCKNYLSKKKFIKKSFDILIYNKPICNEFLFFKLKKILNLKSPFFFKPLYDLIFIIVKYTGFFKNRLIPSFAPFIFGSGDIDKYDFLIKNLPPFSFDDYEKKRGIELLKNLGIKYNDKYICVTFRDSKYLKDKFQNNDWSYHDYRNVDIDYLTPMFDYITSREYFVIRMGRNVEKKIKTNNKKIIDYSNSAFTSDFADVYLLANCSMCISSGTGPDMISRMFRKPIGMLLSPIGYMHCGSQYVNGIYSHYCLDTKKKLNLDQINKKGLINSLFTIDYNKQNVKLIKDNPQYFVNFAMFCIDFLENKFDKDTLKKKQLNFWRQLNKYSIHKKKYNSILFPANFDELMN